MSILLQDNFFNLPKGRTNQYLRKQTMNDNDYYNNLHLIYKYLMKAMQENKPGRVYGYVASAMAVIEAIFRKRGGLQ